MKNCWPLCWPFSKSRKDNQAITIACGHSMGPFLGTTFAQAHDIERAIRRFDRRSDAPPNSGRNTSPPAESSSLRRRHIPLNRNACVKAAKALGWRWPRQHLQGARGCNACGGGYPALLLGLPQRLFRRRHAVRSFSPSTILLFSRASTRCDRLAK